MELLRLASAVNFLDAQPLLDAVASAIAQRLRGQSAATTALLQQLVHNDAEDTVVWPLNLPDDVFSLVLERLGKHDTLSLLRAVSDVSPAWSRGAPDRLRVALRTWARGCTLHELAGRQGLMWFGEHCVGIMLARLEHYPQAQDELRTADGAGWLPLHHAANAARADDTRKPTTSPLGLGTILSPQRRQAQNEAIIRALIDAFGEATFAASKSVHVGCTPRDIARKVQAPYFTQDLLGPRL